MPLRLFHRPSFKRSLKKLGHEQRKVVGTIVEALYTYYASGCSLEERDGERCLPSITIAGYDPNGDGKFDDLAVACVRVFGASTSGMFIDGGGGGTIQLRCRPEVVELCTEKCCGTSPQTE